MFMALMSSKLIFCYCCCRNTLVALATESFHRLIMGKMKIGSNGSLIAVSMQVFWQIFFRNVCRVVLCQAKEFCTNSLFWFVAMVRMIKILQQFTQVSHCGPWASGFSFCEQKPIVLPSEEATLLHLLKIMQHLNVLAIYCSYMSIV